MYFSGPSRTKQHASFVRNIAWLLASLMFYSSSLIPSISAQSGGYECDKYCPVKDCSVYWPGPQFSDCVSAHVNCDCSAKDSNGTLTGTHIGIGIGIFVLIVVGVVGCLVSIRRCSNKETVNSTVVAQPIVANSVHTARWNRNIARAQPVATTMGLPETTHHFPHEYYQPPPYNEAIHNHNHDYI